MKSKKADEFHGFFLASQSNKESSNLVTKFCGHLHPLQKKDFHHPNYPCHRFSANEQGQFK